MSIDIENIIRAVGTRSAQPAATAVKSGTLYSISDENGNIERSNATAWAKYGPQIRGIVKPSDTSRATTTTLADDTSLLFAIGASETWMARFALYVLSASATPDFKYTITVPSGASGNFRESVGGTVVAFATPVTLALDAATDKILVVEVSVANGVTAGNIALQWAQATSDATAVLLKAFSSVMAIKQ